MIIRLLPSYPVRYCLYYKKKKETGKKKKKNRGIHFTNMFFLLLRKRISKKKLNCCVGREGREVADGIMLAYTNYKKIYYLKIVLS